MADLLDTDFQHGFCKIGVQYTSQQLKRFSEELRILNLQKEGKIAVQIQEQKKEEQKSGFIK
jgi:hypothetical protein